ncbi:MAG TPA: hypothetical protein VHL34_05570 [Rhizomicrobium sp.]|nr:hypothetical protein [Rhizomicrobium sp.]
MNKHILAGLFASALLAATPAFAKDDLSAADLASLKSYTLSMDKLNAMQAANDEIAKVPGLAEKAHHVGDNAKSIAEMEAHFNALTQAAAIYKKHGLSAHDAVVMPFAVMDAGMVVMYPSAAKSLGDRTSPAQVAFYKAHQAEIKKIEWASGE